MGTLGEANGGSGGRPTGCLPVKELDAAEKICRGVEAAAVAAAGVVVAVLVGAAGVYAGVASLYVVLEWYEGTSETVSAVSDVNAALSLSIHRHYVTLAECFPATCDSV